MDEFIGIVKIFAGNFAPRNWAFCAGQLLSIAQNTALFSILGTTYGGDGRVTFALPDLRGRVPIGAGQGPGLSNYSLGEVGGVESVTLIATQIAPHTHGVAAYSEDPTTGKPKNNFLANGSVYNTTSDGTTMNPGMIQPNQGGQPHENRQPYLAINYIICINGIFPPRD